MTMKKGLICLSIVAILTLPVMNIAAASTSKQTDEVHSGYTLDVPVKEQPFLVPLPNHNVTAVNTSVDLFAGLATVTSSEIIEKEKEHAYAMSNGSTPLKVRVACSTTGDQDPNSPPEIHANYRTDIPWFAAHGVSEILVFGDYKCDPMPEVCQLAKQYNMRPVYDIERAQVTPPFTNPQTSYTPAQTQLFDSQMQGIKNAGYSGISCEGLSQLTASMINSCLPLYYSGSGSAYWLTKGPIRAMYLEAYYKDSVAGSGANDMSADYLSHFETYNTWTPKPHLGMILGCFGERQIHRNETTVPCDFSEDPGAVLTLLQNMYNAGIDINGFTFLFFNARCSVFNDGVGGGIHAGMSNTWNFVQSLNGLPYYPPGTGHSFPTVSAWRK